ncbi:MAG: helix-turn-helix domain-containing protein [Cyclobacteriaceae bacterium]|nr:helix-turn-helix domain-containing protein [Cyclobacteriaceae bacterium]
MKVLAELLSLVLTYAGIAQGLFVALLLNNKAARKSRANVFLSILLISLSFSIAHILFAGDVLNHFSANVYTLGDPTFFLIAPLLWFYTKELIGERVALSKNLVLHVLPFFIIIFLSLTLKSVDPSFPLMSFLNQHQRFINVFFRISLVIQFSSYQFLIRKKWMAYQEFIKQEVSNKEGVDISWVRFFLIVFLVINLFFFFSLFTAIHFEYGAWQLKATALIFSLAVFALSYKGILQRELFRKVETMPEKIIESLPNALTTKFDEELIGKLLDYMTNKKPYLDSELTLSSLAKDLNISRSQLSLLINEGIGDNFYDFVNKYRVEEVKRLMIDPQVKNYNLLGIALEAGFKSKSTFNLIFKRFTGLTPTEYRKNLSQ